MTTLAIRQRPTKWYGIYSLYNSPSEEMLRLFCVLSWLSRALYDTTQPFDEAEAPWAKGCEFRTSGLA